MINSLGINSYTYNNVVSGTSKLYVPVKPAMVIYSQFDHVSGVAARPNQQGLPVSKVRILNSLIDQLHTMKANPKVNVKDGEFTDKQLDVLIEHFQTKLQTTIQTAQATGYGLAGAAPQVGMIFSLDA